MENMYRLSIPNGEVRRALVDQLIPRYSGLRENEFSVKMRDLKKKILIADIDGWYSNCSAWTPAVKSV